jgi:hypothetical protein
MPVCGGQLKWTVEMREADVDVPVVAMRLTAVRLGGRWAGVDGLGGDEREGGGQGEGD